MAAFTSFVKQKPEFAAQKNAADMLRQNLDAQSKIPTMEDYDAQEAQNIAQNVGGPNGQTSSFGRILQSGFQGYAGAKKRTASEKRDLKMQQIQAAIDYQQKIAQHAADQEQEYNIYQQNLMTVQPALASVIGRMPTMDPETRKDQFGMILNMLGNNLNQDISVHTTDADGNFSAINKATGEPVLGNLQSFAKMDADNPLMAEAWKMRTETGQLDRAAKQAAVQQAQVGAQYAAPLAEAKLQEAQVGAEFARPQAQAALQKTQADTGIKERKNQVQQQDIEMLKQQLGPDFENTPLTRIDTLSPASKTKVINKVLSATDAAEATESTEHLLDKLAKSKADLQSVLEKDVLNRKRKEPTLNAAEIKAVNTYINEGASGHWDSSLLNTLRPEIQDAVQKAAVQQNKLSQAQALILQRGASSDKRELLERMSIPRIDQRPAAFDQGIQDAKETYAEIRRWAKFSELMESQGYVPDTRGYALFKKAAQQSAPRGTSQQSGNSDELNALSDEELDRQIQELEGGNSLPNLPPPMGKPGAAFDSLPPLR